MYRYSRYYLILVLFIFTSITTIGSLLLEYVFRDSSLDQQAVVVMTFMVIMVVLCIIYIRVIVSRIMRDKNMSRQEAGRHLTNNIFFSICYLLLPFFVLYKGCQCRQIVENMKEDNLINRVDKVETGVGDGNGVRANGDLQPGERQ